MRRDHRILASHRLHCKIPLLQVDAAADMLSQRGLTFFPNSPTNLQPAPEKAPAPTLLPLTRNRSADLNFHGPPPWPTIPQQPRHQATVVAVAAAVDVEGPLPLAVLTSRATLAMEQVEEANRAVAEVEDLADAINNKSRIAPKDQKHSLRRRLRLSRRKRSLSLPMTPTMERSASFVRRPLSTRLCRLAITERVTSVRSACARSTRIKAALIVEYVCFLLFQRCWPSASKIVLTCSAV